MVAKIVFNDDSIVELKHALIKQRMGIEFFDLKFSYEKSRLSIKVKGINKVVSQAEYFENIENHLTKAYYSWITPLSKHLKKLKANFKAKVPVLPNGIIDHKNIQIKISAGVQEPGKRGALNRADHLFSGLIPIRDYIHDVEFKGHDFRLTQIVFHLILDGDKVAPCLKQPLNRQILNQWLATLDHTLDERKNEFTFINNYQIINGGKMNTLKYETTLCFFFEEIEG